MDYDGCGDYPGRGGLSGLSLKVNSMDYPRGAGISVVGRVCYIGFSVEGGLCGLSELSSKS